MQKIGEWAPYIDEPKLSQWYKLPPRLQGDLERFKPDGTELDALSPKQWRAVHRAAIAYAEKSVSKYDNPYHNADHFRLVEERGMAAVKERERLQRKPVPEAVKQAFALALRLHDCHHCGATLRVDARKPLYRPELGKRISQEWISAQAADEFAHQHGLSVPARLFIVMVIWSSTYSGNTLRGQQYGIPTVEPVGFWGRLMRAADVCLGGDEFTCLVNAVKITFEETPSLPAPTTWEGFVKMEFGFLDYVMQCFDQLDAVAGAKVTAALGWRTSVTRTRPRVKALLDGRSQDVQRLSKRLLKSGVTLT